MDDYERWRRYRKQSQMMAKLVDASSSEMDFVRCGTRTICDHCGLEYIEHPELSNGLFLICDGMFAKL